jgi:tetratricopeptide (TPR) repeat protein
MAALAAVVAGCGGGGGDIVKVDTEGADPAVAELLERLYEEAKDNPADGRARGRLGMAYEVHLLYHEAEATYAQARELAPYEPRWWYHGAMVRQRLGDLEGAIALMDSTLAREESYGPAWWRRGLWLFNVGDTDEAERSFRRAKTLRPNHPSSWAGLARVYLQRGEPEEAEELLNEAIRRRPQGLWVPYLRHLLGDVYRRTGRIEEARRLLGSEPVERPEWEDPWRHEMDEFRVSLDDRLADLRLLLHGGSADAAIPELEQLRREHPDHERVLTYLAVAYHQAGRTPEAEEVLDSVVESHPDYALGWEKLAEVRAARKNVGGTMQAIDRAVELDPGRANAHLLRAGWLASLGREDEALDSFARCLEIDPHNRDALQGAASIRTSREEWEEAVALWERLVAADPESMDGCLGAAEAHLALGDRERAAELLDRAAELSPEDPRIAPLRRQL